MQIRKSKHHGERRTKKQDKDIEEKRNGKAIRKNEKNRKSEE